MRIIQIIVVLIMVACIAISATALLTDELCVHADENRDHQCDMCSEEMGKCADENKDHKCDNGCDKPFETHQAADGKHTCDYCGKAVSECADADTNHKCDVCNADMGTHGAADGKHTCDYCGKAVSECVDADTNHKCDLCNADMGTHSAADGKHTCDYCGKAASECADADTNHKCDVCNADMGTHGAADGKHTCDYCGKAVSECADADTNHKCDVCNADMGTHGAADGKHTCDYCGKAVSECADADTNHKCDVCNADMGTHGAADGKHTCDYCGKAVSECADADTNHKCDVCNADMGTHGAAAGKHTCDYCGAKVTECTAEEDDGDCTTAILCSVCDAVLTAAKTHDFTGEWLNDADGHWHTCKNADCTATDTKASHVSSGAATETEDEKCTVCNYVINAALGHQHSYSTLKYDSENHWLECSCGEKSNLTAHIANEDDGNCTTAVTCQGCEYVMKAAEAEHKAADKSHNCAACGTELSKCADNNKDHKCDVCEAKLSDCADNNKDHKCDLCGAKLSECADNNKDHKCDLCGTKLSDCADNNKDHKCDLCEAKLSDCADNNKDHKCDLCEAKLSDCADNNKDHKCDLCGTKLSDCADNNKDHNCDVCGAELYPTDGEREVNILYKGDSAYSFMAIDPAGNTDRSAIKGWFTPTVGTNVGLPTLMNPGANQYLQFNKTAQIELFFNKGSDGNTYHIFDNKTNWGVAGAQALFNKEYTYEFEVSANGAFVLSVCDFRTNMGTFADSKDLYGIQFLFDGNTIKMSRCSSGKVEAIAILEGVDFGDGTRRKISFAITRLDLDNGQIRVFVNEEKAMFEATADYGSTTISTNPTPGGTVVNGTLNFPDACKYGQRFTVAPQKLGDGYSTVNIYSYKKLFVKDYTEDNKYTVTLDGGLKFTDGSTTKVVDKYYDVLTNVDWAGYNGLYNVNTGSAFYGLITADVTLGGYSKDANDVIPTLQQLSNTNSNGKASEVTKQNNYIVAGRLGARFTYNGEFTKDYKIRFCNTLANGQKFTGGVTYVSTFTIKNYSDKQLSFTLYEITSGHTLTNFKVHVDLAPGESGTYTIEWSFASANNMLPFIVFDNDHTGDNKGFDFGMALNVVEKK